VECIWSQELLLKVHMAQLRWHANCSLLGMAHIRTTKSSKKSTDHKFCNNGFIIR